MAVNDLLNRLHIGVVYYPEQWPESRWAEDAKLMQEAGVTTVRLAEFAWHKFEPEEGRYELSWLERALEVLSARGIRAILCTPTPTYPAWLHRKYPDIHQVKSNGQLKEFGQRQDACKNHPGYREHALRITKVVAEHFGAHPNVVAWQTDNELGCHGTARCYCERCERAFQTWLSRRFGGDIGRLNEAWGTAFWSQEYNDFSEISPPRDTADRVGSGGQNPGLSLAFYRFSSDVQVEFNRELAQIIRANSPSRLITHNLMGNFTDINDFDLARDLDVVSWDNYPFFQPRAAHLPPAPLPHDLMRGLKGASVWVMEQAAGPGGWDRFYPTPEPGRMRIWALQAFARGADFISFFRWRSARFGTEQYWHGILPHHGQPGARYHELALLAADAARLSPALAGSGVASEIAILYDYDSLWGLEIQPHGVPGLSYHAVAGAYASVLARLGTSFDVISVDQDFSRYRVLVVPTQYVTSETFVRKIHDYLQSGGIAVLGARTSVKDVENAIHEEVLPSGLVDSAGCTVTDYDTFSFLPDESVQVVEAGGASFAAEHLAELLEPSRGAEPLLTYRGRYYSGRVAAVRNRSGKGTAYYLGTFLSEEGLANFLRLVLGEAKLPVVDDLDPAIEITAREREGVTYRFYLNHDSAPKSVRILREGRDLLSGARMAGTVELAGLQVAVVEES